MPTLPGTSHVMLSNNLIFWICISSSIMQWEPRSNLHGHLIFNILYFTRMFFQMWKSQYLDNPWVLLSDPLAFLRWRLWILYSNQIWEILAMTYQSVIFSHLLTNPSGKENNVCWSHSSWTWNPNNSFRKKLSPQELLGGSNKIIGMVEAKSKMEKVS